MQSMPDTNRKGGGTRFSSGTADSGDMYGGGKRYQEREREGERIEWQMELGSDLI